MALLDKAQGSHLAETLEKELQGKREGTALTVGSGSERQKNAAAADAVARQREKTRQAARPR